MGILSVDTAIEAEQVQMEILRRQGSLGRLELTKQAILTSWSLVAMGRDPLERWLGESRPQFVEEGLSAMQPLATPLQVARVLESLNIPYVVGGSYASSVHGEPRSTRDCDLLVDLSPDHHEALEGALEGEFYLSRSALEEAQRLSRSFNLIHLKTGFKVDLFISQGRPFDDSRLERALVIEVQGQPLRFSSAEDTILAKLEWYSISPTDQQWRDVLGIFLVQGDRLDLGYLNFWARDLGVAKHLARAIDAVS